MNASTELPGRTQMTLLQKKLEQFVEANSDIRGAVISTVDGFEVASQLDSSLSAAKLAAMTSSLLALSGAIARESLLGSSRDMVIDADKGRLLLMEVPTTEKRLLLAVLCDNQVTLGQVLWAVNAFRDGLARDNSG
ncbi:MAG TPA: roadblock/LC7 domain-containing protein [Dokdonella sp.]|uniref:roadblock/LC7 domain-containing protein n=1 Tax=Dokdonella sp. TaxID=2291710 RepID=UPI002D808337|nr:roadblock/LC7 domain-containing protein [Dokdonella sp.]HET9033570.1 roadblock/LC7 domain-containing protein [Dokdonella sp.]